MRLEIVRVYVPLDVVKDVWGIIKSCWDKGLIDKGQNSFNHFYTHLTKVAQTYDAGRSSDKTHGTYVASRTEAISLWQFLKWILDEKVVTGPGEIAQVASFISNLAMALDSKESTLEPPVQLTRLTPTNPTTIGPVGDNKMIDPDARPDSEGSTLAQDPELPRGDVLVFPKGPQPL